MNENILTLNQSPENTTNLESNGWEKLQQSFVKLDQITNPDRREYELHCAAQACEVPVDIYRQLFNNHTQAQLISKGKKAFFLFGKSPQQALKTTWEILSKLGWLSMLGILFTLSLQLIELQEREEYLGWSMVALNQEKETNGGRKLALENLKLFGSSLSGLNIKNAVLPKLDLSGTELLQANFANATLIEANLSKTQLVDANLQNADLEKADFTAANLELANLSGSQLYQANFNGANLAYANFTRANLSGADLRNTINLKQANLHEAIYDQNTQFPADFNPAQTKAILITPNADLKGINLQGATLMEADLSGTNLAGANLSGALLMKANLQDANLEGVNLKGAVGLQPNQVKAAKNWDKAEYDPELRTALGL